MCKNVRMRMCTQKYLDVWNNVCLNEWTCVGCMNVCMWLINDCMNSCMCVYEWVILSIVWMYLYLCMNVCVVYAWMNVCVVCVCMHVSLIQSCDALLLVHNPSPWLLLLFNKDMVSLEFSINILQDFKLYVIDWGNNHFGGSKCQ